MSTQLLDDIKDAWNRTWIVQRKRFDGPHFTTQTFQSMLDSRATYFPYLTLVKGSVQPPLNDFSTRLGGRPERLIQPDAVALLMESGYTAKMQRLEFYDDQVLKVSSALERSFGASVTAYAFITPSTSQGLAYHRDGSHVLVYQCEGHKHWRLWEPECPPEGSPGLVDSPTGTLHEFTLAAGDWLYFPHGWVHSARTMGERSAHITWTATSWTLPQYAGALYGQLPSDSSRAKSLLQQHFGTGPQ